MTIYVCTELVADACTTFAPYVNPFLPSLTSEQGLEIGGAVMLCMATAFGIRFLGKFFYTRF